MANITRKNIINALVADGIADIIAAQLDASTEDITATIDKMVASVNRPRKSKPSAETLKNREIAKELAEEVTARGKEVTAADVADFYTDPDGLTLTPRKVGALLKNAAAMGLIDVSPEPWAVKHYGPVGFEFAKKPVRVKKPKDTDNAENTHK